MVPATDEHALYAQYQVMDIVTISRHKVRCVCVRAYVCVHVRACVRTCVHACVRAFMRACVVLSTY